MTQQQPSFLNFDSAAAACDRDGQTCVTIDQKIVVEGPQARCNKLPQSFLLRGLGIAVGVGARGLHAEGESERHIQGLHLKIEGSTSEQLATNEIILDPFTDLCLFISTIMNIMSTHPRICKVGESIDAIGLAWEG